MYLDANNLYGWAMSQHLPTGEFDWLNDEEISNLDITQITDDCEEGYILEVDLNYPKELYLKRLRLYRKCCHPIASGSQKT
jgi:hypothetical protein